jgi:hypothetical protein
MLVPRRLLRLLEAQKEEIWLLLWRRHLRYGKLVLEIATKNRIAMTSGTIELTRRSHLKDIYVVVLAIVYNLCYRLRKVTLDAIPRFDEGCILLYTKEALEQRRIDHYHSRRA